MLYQHRREDHSFGCTGGIGYSFKKELRRRGAHQNGILLKGCEIYRAGHIVAAVIVVADDADVIGHTNAVAAQSIDHSRRHQSRG